jgi:hypothetical protein
MAGVWLDHVSLQSRRHVLGRFEPEPKSALKHIPMLVVTAEIGDQYRKKAQGFALSKR